MRYSSRLRADVVSFARESGLTKAEVSRVLALSETGVGRWLARETSRPPKLQQVAVVRERATSQRDGLELQFPGGARVLGLSLDDVRQLLGAAE